MVVSLPVLTPRKKNAARANETDAGANETEDHRKTHR
jgi:hypothetical protein